MVRNTLAARKAFIALASAGSVGAAHALTIEFDYRFDRGFFTAGNGAPIAERRAVLEAAANIYSGFVDQLSPIAPAAGNSWSATFRHPSWSSYFETATIQNETIATNTLKIFVGGSPSTGSVLGIADSGALTATGSLTFQQMVATRGQAGAAAPVPTDYGPWGGSIWFNSNVDWYFGLQAPAVGATPPNFLTTVTHEIGHLLGFGDAPSWNALAQPDGFGGYLFTGSFADAVFGGPVPLDPIAAHWREGLIGKVDGVLQETLMDPTTQRGQRELMTDLDLAGFKDIGWQISAVPEPGTWLALLAGLGALVRFSKRAQSSISCYSNRI